MWGLVADGHSRGKELTIATQRVTIGDLFAVHLKTLRLLSREEMK
jgi:hypothetical protein